MKKSFRGIPLLLLFISPLPGQAWDYAGHRFVNELALASLPASFPEFARTPEASYRIIFLSGEPDRWRNTADLNHFNAPDHYIDLDDLEKYNIDETHLTHFRHEFTAQLALARAANPDRFSPISPEHNGDQTRQLAGYLPWSIMESYDKLKSGFSYLKAFEKNGTAAEIANARQNIIYIMGVMGHYVGDGAQPLHDTKHHNGWVGENPLHYSRDTSLHAKVDGYFSHLNAEGFDDIKNQLHQARLPAEEIGLQTLDTFDAINAYLVAQSKKAESLYKLEKAGKLFGEGPDAPEGKIFLTRQLLIGGQMLGDLWFSAWQSAPEDVNLEKSLAHRTSTIQNSGKN